MTAKFKVLDRPRTGHDIEARQRRWDEAVTEMRFLERAAWLARRRALLTRERKGKRSRRLFEERVVAPAIARWVRQMTEVRAEMEACGEIIELTINDFVESPVYDTVVIGRRP